MCGYFCIRFINFMLNRKNLTKYTNLFSLYDFRKSDDIIMFYFKDERLYRCNQQNKLM